MIAGFGEDEIFPSYIEYNFEIVVYGKLKYEQTNYMQVKRDKSAIISAFAQKEMVHTFLAGIDPEYKKFLHTFFYNIFTEYPENILSIIPEINEQKKKELLKIIQDVSKGAFKNFIEITEKYSSHKHVKPILQAVYALPKDELASMAESLVNMTSFKRRVSMQVESVGGPIDVAVISKGDGFIWIKRKHYFEPELNPNFFSNYFREDLHYQEGEKNEKQSNFEEI